MATAEKSIQSLASERTEKVVVPLVGTAFAFLAAILSGYVLYFTNGKTSTIQEKLGEIQKDQAAAERSAKLDQFNRESERQYVALVYTDLTSRDASRQRAALSLLEILQPETSLKLVAWANKANIVFAENKPRSQEIERRLDVEQRLEFIREIPRFRVFLHLGKAKNRPVPDVDAIKKVLADQGFSISGIDDQSDDYGPGVDYFYTDDQRGAQEVAKILVALLQNNSASMRARRQSAVNRSGTLGVWF